MKINLSCKPVGLKSTLIIVSKGLAAGGIVSFTKEVLNIGDDAVTDNILIIFL